MPPSSPDQSATAAAALRKLARAGAAKQMGFAVRDAAGFLVVGAVVFSVVSKPVGLVVALSGLLLLAVFGLMVTTAGARLQKAVREPGRIRSVVLATSTRRRVLARAWVIGADNRSVTVPFLAAEADVVAATFGRALPGTPVKRFDDEATARTELKRLQAAGVGAR